MIAKDRHTGDRPPPDQCVKCGSQEFGAVDDCEFSTLYRCDVCDQCWEVSTDGQVIALGSAP